MILTLSGSALTGILPSPRVTGINPLFRAKIQVGETSIRCYVKPQPDQIVCPARLSLVANREIVNEALGYVLAKASGFRVPDIAGVILLRTSQLPSHVVEKLRSGSGGSIQEDYFCWFSKDMDRPNLVQKFGITGGVSFLEERRRKRLADHLMESGDTPRIIALDDWLANSDRHPGNVLDGDGAQMLIDHGRILRFPNWTPGDLGGLPPGQSAENRLRNFIDYYEPKWSSALPRTSAMLMAYNAFAVSFRKHGEAAARQVLAEFLDSADVDAVIKLLHNRHNSAAYAKATGMVL